jgi:Alpha/beta hydrolase family
MNSSYGRYAGSARWRASPVRRLVLRSATLRRLGFREVACHGDRLTAARALEFVADSIDCPFIDDYSADEPAEPLDPLPCPVTLVWAQFDRLVPAMTYGQTARERPPGATWILLPGVGHIPMIDDPDLVARTIAAVTGVPGSGDHRRRSADTSSSLVQMISHGRPCCQCFCTRAAATPNAPAAPVGRGNPFLAGLARIPTTWNTRRWTGATGTNGRRRSQLNDNPPEEYETTHYALRAGRLNHEDGIKPGAVHRDR